MGSALNNCQFIPGQEIIRELIANGQHGIAAQIQASWARAEEAFESAKTAVMPAARPLTSAPLPPPPPAPNPETFCRMFSGSEVREAVASARRFADNARSVAQTLRDNPTVPAAAAGSGALTAGALLHSSAGAVLTGELGTTAAVAGGGLVLLAGAAGAGVGRLIDWTVGTVRNDGLTLSDLLSGDTSVPIAGMPGSRLIPDKE